MNWALIIIAIGAIAWISWIAHALYRRKHPKMAGGEKKVSKFKPSEQPKEPSSEEKLGKLGDGMIALGTPPPQSSEAEAQGKLETLTAGDDVIVTVPRDLKKIQRAKGLLNILENELKEEQRRGGSR